MEYLSRWFFHWSQRESRITDFISTFQRAAWVKNDFSLVYKRPAFYAIAISPSAWKLSPSTWWRRGLRDGIKTLFPDVPSLVEPTVACWACVHELFPEDRDQVRIISTQREAEEEAATLWCWVWHICNLPFTQQRSLPVGEFDRWLRDPTEVSLPSIPRKNLLTRPPPRTGRKS